MILPATKPLATMNTDFATLMSQLFHTGQFGHINIVNFLISTVMVWIMVHFLYYGKSRRRDYDAAGISEAE